MIKGSYLLKQRLGCLLNLCTSMVECLLLVVAFHTSKKLALLKHKHNKASFFSIGNLAV